MRSFFLSSILAVVCLGGCSGEPAAPVPMVPRAWSRLSPPASTSLGNVRGFVTARGIIHSHSPYSHDGCDKNGLDANGTPNATCVAHLRQGMCDAAEDFVFLTDHAANMAAAEMNALLFIQPGDEPLTDPDGAPFGNFIPCADGRRVLLMTGNENTLMAVGIDKHLPGDAQTRKALYESDGATTVQAMHDVGALVFLAHTESRTPEYLKTIPVDGVEIYNIHAAIDPDIRRDYLGLDAYAAGASILPFTRQDEDGPEPDLAILGFLQDLPQYGQLWDPMLAERHVTGSVGTDVHENSFPGMMRDGERGDSYRRLMRWISNVALVDGILAPSTVKAAIKAGRSYVAFEILGVPAGFDFHAEDGSNIVEMGGQAKPGASIVVQAPKVWNLDPAVEKPTIQVKLLRIANGSTTTVAEGGDIRLDAAEAGVYRVEVRILPNHLKPYLGETPDTYIREFPWVLSNAIRVF
ncbi:MAG TPA: hypothetical protein PK156_03515 [Polyangium sp.]|nr:hypothetical protein [Polyangium sp.]